MPAAVGVLVVVVQLEPRRLRLGVQCHCHVCVQVHRDCLQVQVQVQVQVAGALPVPLAVPGLNVQERLTASGTSSTLGEHKLELLEPEVELTQAATGPGDPVAAA